MSVFMNAFFESMYTRVMTWKKYFWLVVELNELFWVDYEYKLHFENSFKNLPRKTENKIDKRMILDIL